MGIKWLLILKNAMAKNSKENVILCYTIYWFLKNKIRIRQSFSQSYKPTKYFINSKKSVGAINPQTFL